MTESLIDAAARLCRELGGDPLTSDLMSELTGKPPSTCVSAMWKACARGLMYRHQSVGRTAFCFESEAAFNAFGAERVAKLAQARINARSKLASTARFGDVLPAPVTLYTAGSSRKKIDPDAPATLHPRCKFTTQSPLYVARWQAIPDSGVSIFADRPTYGSK